jgi:hypothetical protein
MGDVPSRLPSVKMAVFGGRKVFEGAVGAGPPLLGEASTPVDAVDAVDVAKVAELPPLDCGARISGRGLLAAAGNGLFVVDLLLGTFFLLLLCGIEKL